MEELEANCQWRAIVYAPEAVVAHVAESVVDDFWESVPEMQERMLGYCVSIQGTTNRPRIDFIGSSTMVLLVAPLWLTAVLTGLPFFTYFYNLRIVVGMRFRHVADKCFVGTLGLLLVQELILWRGPLGVVIGPQFFMATKIDYTFILLLRG